MSQKQRSNHVHISANDIGGIDETEIQFTPGVNVLAGRNATNRTSLLQAIMAALGSERISLKGDSDEGRAELTIGDETYTRTLKRGADGTVTTAGSPYLDDAGLADLFAFLLGSNEARRAVARSDDLHDLIMRPVDTEAIQAEIDRLEDEKRRLDDELEELDSLARELPDHEGERARLRDALESKRAELDEIEAEIESADADVDERRGEKATVDEKLAELREARADLEDVRFDIGTEEESIAALRSDLGELEAEAETMSDTPAEELDEIGAEIERIRERRESVESTVSELGSVIEFNEEMLEGRSAIGGMLGESGDSSGAITDQLVSGDETTCWTCGTAVAAEQIERTLDLLRSLRREKLDERNELRDRLDELKARRDSHEEDRRRRERISDRIESTEAELEKREDRLEELNRRETETAAEIEDLEAAVEDLEADRSDELLERHREANRLEFEIGRLRSELEETEAEIDSIEDRLDRREEIETERSEVTSQLDDLRTRIEQIESQAVEEFNAHMDTVLEILGYANLERIWIERTEKEVREGRRKVTRSVFDLHVVRRTGSGSAYEDTIDHLSESEREVTGLVFALAGYLVHDVHETVPFMLLDSLEAIDSERIALLVDYFGEYADYLVVALLEEDAAAVDEGYHRVTEI